MATNFRFDDDGALVFESGADQVYLTRTADGAFVANAGQIPAGDPAGTVQIDPTSQAQYFWDRGRWSPISVPYMEVGRLVAGITEMDIAAIKQMVASQGFIDELFAGQAVFGSSDDAVFIKDGTITAPNIQASEQLSAKIGMFGQALMDELTVQNVKVTNELISDILRGKLVEGATIDGGLVNGARMVTDEFQIRASEAGAGSEVVSYSEDFGTSLGGWTAEAGTASRDTSVKYSGVASMRILPSTGIVNFAITAKTVSITTDRKNVVKARFRVGTPPAGKTAGFVGLVVYKDGSLVATNPVTPTPNIWVEAECVLPRNLGGTVIIKIMTMQGQTLWVDKVEILTSIYPPASLKLGLDEGNIPVLLMDGESGTEQLRIGRFGDKYGVMIKDPAGVDRIRLEGQSGVDASVAIGNPAGTGYYTSLQSGRCTVNAAIGSGQSESTRGYWYSNAPTVTGAANLRLEGNRIFLVSSARANKGIIRDAEVNMRLLDLPVRTWVDRGLALERAMIIERNANREAAGQLDQLEPVPELRRYVGIVAEEAAELGETESLEWDADGNLVGVQYDRLIYRQMQAHIAYTRGLEARIEALEARLEGED